MDDKGRLKIFWWRINIIDFLVLLFLLTLPPIFYFGHKITTREVEIEVKPPTITLDKVEYEQDQKRLKKLDIYLQEHKKARKYFRKD